MKKRKLLLTVLIATALAATLATPALARRCQKMEARPHAGRIHARMTERGPALTAEQREQIKEIRGRHDEERVELMNRARVLEGEMLEIVHAGDPDFDAIEHKMEEIAEIRLELAKLRLRVHKEIRPLLDDDQRILFDRRIGAVLGHGSRAAQPRRHAMAGGDGAGPVDLCCRAGMPRVHAMSGECGRMGHGRADAWPPNPGGPGQPGPLCPHAAKPGNETQ